MALELTNTWGTDKAIIEEKALDKQGDTMQGDLTMEGAILDANGEKALEIDVGKQKLNMYGHPLSTCFVGAYTGNGEAYREINIGLPIKFVVVSRNTYKVRISGNRSLEQPIGFLSSDSPSYVITDESYSSDPQYNALVLIEKGFATNKLNDGESFARDEYKNWFNEKNVLYTFFALT